MGEKKKTSCVKPSVELIVYCETYQDVRGWIDRLIENTKQTLTVQSPIKLGKSLCRVVFFSPRRYFNCYCLNVFRLPHCVTFFSGNVISHVVQLSENSNRKTENGWLFRKGYRHRRRMDTTNGSGVKSNPGQKRSI